MNPQSISHFEPLYQINLAVIPLAILTILTINPVINFLTIILVSITDPISHFEPRYQITSINPAIIHATNQYQIILVIPNDLYDSISH